MYSIYLVLEIDTGKKIFFEIEKYLDEEQSLEKISTTNNLQYEGKEKVVNSYLSRVKTCEVDEIFKKEKRINIKE